MKKNQLDSVGYQAMLASTTKLNRIGPELADLEAVHAVTDVTGFGLLGHLLEMCRGAGLAADLDARAVPTLPGAAQLAQAGFGTGAATRNWASYGPDVRLPDGVPDWGRGLLCDPQTSGGLLVAVRPDRADDIVARCHAGGFTQAAIIGAFTDGAGVTVRG